MWVVDRRLLRLLSSVLFLVRGFMIYLHRSWRKRRKRGGRGEGKKRRDDGEEKTKPPL